jgi:hypothetical protein
MTLSLVLSSCNGGDAGTPETTQPAVDADGSTTTTGGTPTGSTSGSPTSFKAYSYSDRAFPDDNVWNTDISKAEVDPNSTTYINSMGSSGTLHADFGTVWAGEKLGIPVNVVHANQPKVPVSFLYAESDKGPCSSDSQSS